MGAVVPISTTIDGGGLRHIVRSCAVRLIVCDGPTRQAARELIAESVGKGFTKYVNVQYEHLRIPTKTYAHL